MELIVTKKNYIIKIWKIIENTSSTNETETNLSADSFNQYTVNITSYTLQNMSSKYVEDFMKSVKVIQNLVSKI